MTSHYTARPGKPYPLGATWDGAGVNFALFSEHAEAVDLCLFDRGYGATEAARIPVQEQTGYVWHVYVPEARPGLLYGWRVHGAWDPQDGLRFNANKLLLDPYAKATSGSVAWSASLFGHDTAHADDLTFDERDSAPYMAKGVVIEAGFSWGDDRPLRTPWHDTLIYEAHVKGLTRLWPDLPETLRGTYAGLADPKVINYLQELGITAIELLPVHQSVSESHLLEHNLTNYWGYNTLAFFAPDPRLAAAQTPGAVVNEFKTMVKSLHNAGIEVILDVVYNHTAEGNHLGPTLSLKGIDNLAYYRLVPDDARYYMDFTGTGNTINMLNPFTVQLVMDSLRYWVQEMHIDGFRFDLATALAREVYEVDQLSAFFQVVHQDPVISQVKLIAEPWDVGHDGYQVGNFPVHWTEWNGRYRDSIRRFWRGEPGQLGELAYRLTGSSDLYAHNGRRPYASVNFVTCHDGFTLHDLVSYERKHNEANAEDNRDGTNDNLSWNGGVEGETTNPSVLTTRAQQMRNFLTTLAVSQGVPMLLAGDEIARTQGGNNNAYCQDNDVSWLNWTLDESRQAMLDWTKRVFALRREHPALRRRTHFQGRPIVGAGVKDISWLRPDGSEMTEEVWHEEGHHALGMWLAGAATDLTDDEGTPIHDDTLVVLLNSSSDGVEFRLPPGGESGEHWQLLVDTSRPTEPGIEMTDYRGRQRYPLRGRSMAIFRLPAKRR
jgi:glycogen operon protein